MEPARLSEPRIRNVCGPPLYSGVTTPFGALIWLSLGKTSSAMPRDRVQRDRRGRAAAEQHDQHTARSAKRFHMLHPQRGRALVIHGVSAREQLMSGIRRASGAHGGHVSPRSCRKRSGRTGAHAARQAGETGTLERRAQPPKPRAVGPRARGAAGHGRLHGDLHPGREQLAGGLDEPHAEPRLERVADLRRAVSRRCAWRRTS